MTGTFLRLLKATSLASLVALALIPMTASAEGEVQFVLWDCGKEQPCRKVILPEAAGGKSPVVAGAQQLPGAQQPLVVNIPEPTPLALFGLGLAVLGLVRHRKRKAELKSMATDKLEQQTLH